MGRTGDSLQYHFPPRSGGGSLDGVDSRCREEAGWPTGKIVVVVVVGVVVVVVVVAVVVVVVAAAVVVVVVVVCSSSR